MTETKIPSVTIEPHRLKLGDQTAPPLRERQIEQPTPDTQARLNPEDIIIPPGLPRSEERDNRIAHTLRPDGGGFRVAAGDNAVRGLSPTKTARLMSTAARRLLAKYDGLGRQGFHDAMRRIYGDTYNPAKMDQLVEQLRAGNLNALPSRVEVVDSRLLGSADGAFHGGDDPAVFLSSALLSDPQRLQRVFDEEWLGHGLGSAVTGEPWDSQKLGDTGEALARWLGGESLDSAILQTRTKDDLLSFDLNHGGTQLRVLARASTSTMYRRYETKGAYQASDWQGAGEERLAREVDQALIKAFPGNTLGDVEAHLKSKNLDYDTERLKVANRLLRSRPPGSAVTDVQVDKALVASLAGKKLEDGTAVTTLRHAKTYLAEQKRSYDGARAAVEKTLLATARTAAVGAHGKTAATDALAAATMAKLKKAGLLDPSATLNSPLPANVQALVDADPQLKAVKPKVSSYGQLLGLLIGDEDGDGKRDIDTFALAKFLPDAEPLGRQQKILRAVQADMGDLQRELNAAGYTHTVSSAAINQLTLVPPDAFGLAGANAIDKEQQQWLLRTGLIFLDSNNNNRVDDTDEVQYLHSDGTIREAQYKDLDPKLQRLVQLNLATAEAIEKYAGVPGQHMKFPKYHRATRQSDPETVNTTFWKVSDGPGQQAGQRLTSWELNPPKKPSEAIADIFTGNGGMYTTECAHARSIMRLRGLQCYYEKTYPDGEGTFRFDALFAKDASEKAKASAYLAKYEDFKKKNPGKGWTDFIGPNPTPTLSYALEVCRHSVVDANEHDLNIWGVAPSNSGSAAGTFGYFNNRSVSPLGVKIGYIGENVIDLGFKNGIRRYWGHPGGIQKESVWQSELAHGDIPIKKMSDYGQYFSAADVQHRIGKWRDAVVEEIDKQITDLTTNKPAGWNTQVEQLERQKAGMNALHDVRHTLQDGFRSDRLETARAWLTANAGKTLSNLSDFKGLYDTLTPAAKAKMTAAFDRLHADQRKALATLLGQSDPSTLTAQQKALAAMLICLREPSGKMYTPLVSETQQAVTNGIANQWINGKVSSAGALDGWIKTSQFKQWYKTKTGSDYAGPTTVAAMTVDQIQQIVELALPMTALMPTAFGRMSADITVGRQMAMLLKTGKLPDADYRAGQTFTPDP